MKNRIAIVGAGFSGAVLARELAEHSACRVVVFDVRDHIAGNCHTTRDDATGIMIHRYGPHIFHTSNEVVWNYINRWGELRPFSNRVKAHTPRGIFSFPINLHTINQFFGKTFSPHEAEDYLNEIRSLGPAHPSNFEEAAISAVGEDLYRNFFYGYTRKHWGCEPREIPASVFSRIPVRYDYNDVYYSDRWQAIPVNGYTALIEAILDHPSIDLKLATPVLNQDSWRGDFDHLFYTGTIDGWFGHEHGRLGYRTVEFERHEGSGNFQGNAVINYTSSDVPYTRVHEHKHFAPWESHERTVWFREFSKATAPEDSPYYPIRREADKTLLARYREMAMAERNVSFLGRLGTYRYLDMDKVIAEALAFSQAIMEARKNGEEIPVFPAGA